MTVNMTPETRDTLSAVLAAIQMVGVTEPPVVPLGKIGGCVACGHTVASHFSGGDFIGCLKGTRDTVFILVPAVQKAAAAAAPVNGHGARRTTVTPDRATSNEAAPAPPLPVVARGFVRARYVSMLHHKAKVENLHLSPTRAKVLRAIHDTGKDGIIARDIRKRCKLPHGSVQQTLNWLRSHPVKGQVTVAAREDAPATAS